MKRGFSHYSRSWYAANLPEGAHRKDIRDEIMFGLYDEEGGTGGEMAVRWLAWQNEAPPRLECFYDAWGVLAQFSDVIAKLGEASRRITPDDFRIILEGCGFEDRTQTEAPEWYVADGRCQKEDILDLVRTARQHGVCQDLLFKAVKALETLEPKSA